MISKDIRSQFRVMILHDLIDKGAEIRNELAEVGFPTFLFNDEDLFFVGFKQDAPHIVIFRRSALNSPLDQFVESLLKINNEVVLVPICDTSEIELFKPYRQYNFDGLLTIGPGFSARAIWLLDEICERLALTYQNEQLNEQIQLLCGQVDGLTTMHQVHQKKMDSQLEVARTLRLEEVSRNQSSEIQHRLKIGDWRNLKNREELVDSSLRLIQTNLKAQPGLAGSKMNAIYLRYLSSIQSYVVTHTVGVPIGKFQGIGVTPDFEETAQLKEIITRQEPIKAIVKLMESSIGNSDFWFRYIQCHQQPDSMFLVWPAEQVSDEFYLNEQMDLFELVIESIQLKTRNLQLEIIDTATGLYLNGFFQKRLEEEIARARRIEKPVSLVHFSIDQEQEMKTQWSPFQRDSVLKIMGQMIQKSSRVTDIVARLGENHFSLILPHTSRRGASVRADRIRRMIESHSHSSMGVRITVSCGISEYPSLGASAAEVNQLAFEALQFIRQKGPSKLALSKPQTNYKPHFDVPPA